jgi:hypothetical protein
MTTTTVQFAGSIKLTTRILRILCKSRGGEKSDQLGDEFHIHTLDISAEMSPHNNVATHIQKNNGSPVNHLLKPPRNVGISKDAKP